MKLFLALSLLILTHQAQAAAVELEGTEARELSQVLSRSYISADQSLQIGFIGNSCTISYKAISSSLKAYSSEGMLNIYFTQADAMRLFERLQIEAIEEAAASVKIFVSDRENVKIICLKSFIPIGNPYACTVSISL